MLSIRDMSVGYGGRIILNRLNLDFRPGTLTALIGPNGSGKSSLLRAIAGLQRHDGSVALSGADDSAAGSRDQITYMPQDTGAVSSLTMLEVVLLGRLDQLGFRVPEGVIQEATEVLAEFGLTDIQHRAMDQISGGQRQLAFLAQAMFRLPSALLLDEPTSALDLRHQLIVLEKVREHVRSNGMIAIAAMHDLTLAARFADRIICLCDGEIHGDGAPAEVLTPALIQHVYRVSADLLHAEDNSLAILPRSACNCRGTGSGSARHFSC